MRIAIGNNPELIAASERVKQAKSEMDIDLSSILPQVDSEASSKRGKASGRSTANTHSYGVTGKQLVFDGFKTSSEVSSAYKTIQAEEYNYTVKSSDIRLNLRMAFVSLLRAEELVNIAKEIARRRHQNLELIKLRYEGGREHKGALLTAEADMAQAKFEIAQAKRSISLAQRELFKELGLTRVKSVKALGEFILKRDYSTKPDLDFLANTTPFLQELIVKKEATRYDFQSEVADFFPKVYMNASLGKTGNSFLPRNEEWSAGASISLPLFEGGSRIAEVSKAKSQLNEAEADERSGRDSVLVTLERAWKDLQDATTNVSVQKKFLKANEERAKITRVQYSTGLASFNDWIIIEDNLVKSQKAYLNTESDMLIAEAYWIQAIGGTLEYD
ncbi:MAG: TolC family protein [Candidatus Omnitrophica bacterium]|nr:TolC family protein [Candidatus Omnitrophota bacterium]